jgi:3-dehydroquinate dehydratase
MKGKPCYTTYYRGGHNVGKPDDELADGMLTLADCGATLIDVMGDLFCRHPEELTDDAEATAKQTELIDRLHARGAEVLMSSHLYKFAPAERVLEIALEHQRRGADISKIVTGADTAAEQIENLRIINLLKESLEIPFLFLCGGECRIMRRIGGELGCCMYLCVAEHDELSTPAQPLISDIIKIREIF